MVMKTIVQIYTYDLILLLDKRVAITVVEN